MIRPGIRYMEQTKSFEVLEQLEKRISQAVENAAELRSECSELRDEKVTLRTEIEELTLGDGKNQITGDFHGG